MKKALNKKQQEKNILFRCRAICLLVMLVMALMAVIPAYAADPTGSMKHWSDTPIPMVGYNFNAYVVDAETGNPVRDVQLGMYRYNPLWSDYASTKTTPASGVITFDPISFSPVGSAVSDIVSDNLLKQLSIEMKALSVPRDYKFPTGSAYLGITRTFAGLPKPIATVLEWIPKVIAMFGLGAISAGVEAVYSLVQSGVPELKTSTIKN